MLGTISQSSNKNEKLTEVMRVSNLETMMNYRIVPIILVGYLHTSPSILYHRTVLTMIEGYCTQSAM